MDDLLTRFTQHNAGPPNPPPAGHQTPKITVKTPPTLDDDLDLKKLVKWRTSWHNYTLQVSLDKQTREQQIASLWQFFTPDLLAEVRHAMGIAPDTTRTVDEVLDEMQTFLRAKRNLVLDRINMARLTQQKGQSLDKFITRLRDIAEDAELDKMQQDEWLATLVIAGITDEETRQKLLALEKFPTYEQTIALCRREETARVNKAELDRARSGTREPLEVGHARRQSNYQKNRRRSQGRDKAPPSILVRMPELRTHPPLRPMSGQGQAVLQLPEDRPLRAQVPKRPAHQACS